MLCKYYAKYVTFPLPNRAFTGTFTKELKSSYAYFPNNIEPRIYKLVRAEFSSIEPLGQGDPLFLKCILNYFVLSNEADEAAALVDAVFNYSIKIKSKTKNILEISQNLSAITDTIMAICEHKENPLPNDYVQHPTSIYQTTSVEAFNCNFAKLDDDVIYS